MPEPIPELIVPVLINGAIFALVVVIIPAFLLSRFTRDIIGRSVLVIFLVIVAGAYFGFATVGRDLSRTLLYARSPGAKHNTNSCPSLLPGRVGFLEHSSPCTSHASFRILSNATACFGQSRHDKAQCIRIMGLELACPGPFLLLLVLIH